MPPADLFPAMIAGLESAGLSRADIAEQAQVSKTTIWRMANSTSRDHLSATASRVAGLHERVVGGDTGDVASQDRSQNVSWETGAIGRN
ncbi:hypothetical protein OOJ09_31510 [Mesorhizobium qingshengii]|uniref:Helix-turn-helix n=1 Tax=Mesorhizobium qingshengii TaxID=1165689 RepID=A0ABT4R4E7_9HYPH|nr:hypothetical protein [Mesorhizobium qingshengii]MCZ8548705.1 hypothetical protein [Mesorhizobium qingshengii]